MDRNNENQRSVDSTASARLNTDTLLSSETHDGELVGILNGYPQTLVKDIEQKGLIWSYLHHSQSLAVDHCTAASSSCSQQTYASPECDETDPTTLSESHPPSLKEIQELYGQEVCDKVLSHTRRSSTDVEPSDQNPSASSSSPEGTVSFCSETSGRNQQDFLILSAGTRFGPQEGDAPHTENDPVQRDLQELESNTRDSRALYITKDVAQTSSAPAGSGLYTSGASELGPFGQSRGKKMVLANNVSSFPSTKEPSGHVSYDEDGNVSANVSPPWNEARHNQPIESDVHIIED